MGEEINIGEFRLWGKKYKDELGEGYTDTELPFGEHLRRD